MQLPFWLAPVLLYSYVLYSSFLHEHNLIIPDIRDFAYSNIPQAFSQRVRNALKAEARSVKLSALVGSGGLWYGFGRMITGM